MKIEKYKVSIELQEPVLGTVPKNKEVYASYIATRAQKLENGAEEIATVQEVEEKGWTGFHQDETGIFVYDYYIRGFLKNAANVLKEQTGIKNSRSKIDNLVFVFPRRNYWSRDGKILKSADGVIERPLRAQTMQGPRVTLARSDYLSEGSSLEFEIRVIQGKEKIDKGFLESILDYGQLCGLGQFRNGSYGRFSYKLKGEK